MENLCSCVDLKYSNVISAALSVRRPEIGRSSVDVQYMCSGLRKL